VGTLVVAVAGFYFGSTAVSSAVAAERTSSPSKPVVDSIFPTAGAKNADIDLRIRGSGLNRTRAVRLVRGTEQMLCRDVLSNAEQIQCKVKIDGEPGSKWDLIVTNDDGAEVRVAEAFSIIEAEPPQQR
jgi:hypothetical protein